ncbi:MAG: hypothetical protein EXR72_08735 [Myxococcales bacterium]|nr:hypothetical protein [Myxococcales bacterium]
MGLPLHVDRDRVPLELLLAALATAGMACAVMMVDGGLRAPGAAPPEEWRDVRLRTPAGTVTLTRDRGGVTVMVFGNADAALQAAQRRIADAISALPDAA